MITTELRDAELDEVEMCLQLLQMNHPVQVNSATYSEIAQMIESNFDIRCPVEFISLLHEPTIEQVQEDLEIHLRVLGF